MIDNHEKSLLSFEERKWNEERALRSEEIALRARELELREAENLLKTRESERSKWFNPLVVAIFGAAIAGAFNGVAVIAANSGQNRLESDKSNYINELESKKSTRILLSDLLREVQPTELCRRLKFVDEMNFTEVPAYSSAVRSYLTKNCVASPPAGSAQPRRITEVWTSDSIGGGHNQSEQCRIGQAFTQQKYPGKTIALASSSEQSTKNLFGRVSYKYFCTFNVD